MRARSLAVLAALASVTALGGGQQSVTGVGIARAAKPATPRFDQPFTATARSAPAGLRATLHLKTRRFKLPGWARDPDRLADFDAMRHPDALANAPGAAPPPQPAFAEYARLLEDLEAAGWKDGQDPTPILKANPTLMARTLALMTRQKMGRTAQRQADARYQARFGDRARSFPVPPPSIGATLRLHNDSDHDVVVRVDGDPTPRRLLLTGPAAVAIVGSIDMTERMMLGREVVVPAHGHADLPVSDLTYGDRSAESGWYWTAPGRYELTLEQRLEVRDPSGGFRVGTVAFAPFELDVAP